MPTTQPFTCFPYAGSVLNAQLTTEQGGDGRTRVYCPVRQGFYSLTPEERIRQAFVWFVTTGSQSARRWAQELSFFVERSSLDVSAFHGRPASEPHFAPSVPVVIIETKRIERDAADDTSTDEQIQGYMVRERCRSGFIFNGRQAAWLTLSGSFTAPQWTKATITDLAQAEKRINEAADAVAIRYAKHEACFARASRGDFSAFAELVEEFGVDASLTFSLSVRIDDGVGPIRAFNPKVASPELVTCRTRGTGMKHRLELTPANFHGLRAVGSI